jgi:hypothetical protein
VNRALGGDYPGTLGVRRDICHRTGGYDGDVLFENLELIRTVEAAGGVATAPLDLYVRRLPPTVGHFWHQRIRQAYEDFALPLRCALWLSIVPLTLFLVASSQWPVLLCLALLLMVVAEFGRSRAGGRRVFRFSSTVLAPIWVAERSVLSWWALGQWVRGGCAYGGGRIRRAATSKRTLRRRLLAARVGLHTSLVADCASEGARDRA